MTDKPILTLWRETMLLQIRYREKLNQRVICAVLLMVDLETEDTKPHLLVPPAGSPMYPLLESVLSEHLQEVTPDWSQDQVFDLIQNVAKGWNA